LPPKKPLVAVISPFYNRATHVRDWISGLEKQTYEKFRLYLVDDGSQDGTQKLLQETLAQSKLSAWLLPLKKNQGPAATRNLAIQAALGDGADLILLLDSDCRVYSDWIERHVKVHKQRQDTKIVGGGIQGVSHSIIGKADGFCSWFSAVPYGSSGPVKKLHLSTTNMSIKREVFETVGFFDKELATGEDVAFCRRAQNKNQVLWFQSDIIAIHKDRNEVQKARQHHYRFGLHSFTLSNKTCGGYYGLLKKFNSKALVALLVPVFAILNTGFVVWQFTRQKPSVWLYLPWIFYLKWWNAIGVYHGYRNPSLCLKAS